MCTRDRKIIARTVEIAGRDRNIATPELLPQGAYMRDAGGFANSICLKARRRWSLKESPRRDRLWRGLWIYTAGGDVKATFHVVFVAGIQHVRLHAEVIREIPGRVTGIGEYPAGTSRRMHHDLRP